MAPIVPKLALGLLCSTVLMQTDCALLAAGTAISAGVTCPDVFASDPLSVKFTAREDLNTAIGAFVLAANDLLDVSGDAEMEAKNACLRIGHDLGLSDADMAPPDITTTGMAAACGAVARRVATIVRGGVRLELHVSPPRCTVEASVDASCSSRCAASASSGTSPGTSPGRHPRGRGLGHAPPPAPNAGSQASGECAASCRAHAALQAKCEMPRVTVRGDPRNPEAARLVATLSANLPPLVHAELGLARRALEDLKVLADVGARLETIVDEGGDKAVKCVVAALELTTVAAVSLGLTIDASAKVTASVGGQG